MKRKRMSARESATLYARLIVEEHEASGNECAIIGPAVKAMYLQFLRAHRHIHPAYELAIRQIEGRG